MTFRVNPKKTYIAFNKPYEVLVQYSPEKLPGGGLSEKITLASFGFPADVYPVGRLDYDSEGLLLLSDDGRLTGALFDSPHPRTYLVQIEGVPTADALGRLARGVVIQGKKTKPAQVELLAPEDEPAIWARQKPVRYRKEIPTSWLSLTLTQGMNRQVRRMTAAVGHPTLRLVRWAIGALDLQTLWLGTGEWRRLSLEEVSKVLE